MPKKPYGEKYNPEMRESDFGSRLYQMWKRMRKHPHVEEWDCYPPFYDWAMQSGYLLGDHLYRLDESIPYGPTNCSWEFQESGNNSNAIPPEWADTWNKTVNVIRKHYGMPPLGKTN